MHKLKFSNIISEYIFGLFFSACGFLFFDLIRYLIIISEIKTDLTGEPLFYIGLSFGFTLGSIIGILIADYLKYKFLNIKGIIIGFIFGFIADIIIMYLFYNIKIKYYPHFQSVFFIIMVFSFFITTFALLGYHLPRIIKLFSKVKSK